MKTLVPVVAMMLVGCATTHAQVPPPPNIAADPEVKTQPIGVLSVGKFGIFHPLPDITPEESAWFSLMLAIGLSQSSIGTMWDYDGFICLHHLQRHFENPKGTKCP